MSHPSFRGTLVWLMLVLCQIGFLSPTLLAQPNESTPINLSLDANQPIDGAGNIVFDPQIIVDSGARWVRINFLLAPWSHPTDSTPQGVEQRTWFETFDLIVQDALDHNLTIVGTVSQQSVSSCHALKSQEYRDDYVESVGHIIEHFQDRVHYFHSFHEPDDHGDDPNDPDDRGDTALMAPESYARLLTDLYQAKIDRGWTAELISGPVFAHAIGGEPAGRGAVNYLRKTFEFGTSDLGWNDFRNRHGTYPFDGVGVDMYPAHDPSVCSTDHQDYATCVRVQMGQILDGVWDAIVDLDGEETDLRIWAFEVGWRSDASGVGESGQADNVKIALDLLETDCRVRFVNWFCRVDFDTGKLDDDGNAIFDNFGLTKTDGTQKPSWSTFQANSPRQYGTTGPRE